MNLSKSQKISIFLSVVWTIICLITASGFSESSYSGAKNYTKFAASFFVISAPVWLYWVGVWIWGFGYLYRSFRYLLNFNAWRRYWARSLDYLFYGLILTGIYIYFFPLELGFQNERENLIKLTSPVFWFIVIAISVIFESILLTIYRTTLGKAVLRISIVNSDASPLTVKQALYRSLKVWFRGMFFGFPFFSAITLIASYIKFQSNKITSWDEDGSHTVHYGHLNLKRYCITIIIFISSIFILNFFYSEATPMNNMLDKYVETSSLFRLDSLSPQRLSNPHIIEQSIQGIKSAQTIATDYETNILNRITHIGNKYYKSDNSNEKIKILADRIIYFFNLEREVNKTIDETLKFFQENSGRYAINKNKVNFLQQKDLDFYNNHVQKLKSLGKAREKVIQQIMSG